MPVRRFRSFLRVASCAATLLTGGCYTLRPVESGVSHPNGTVRAQLTPPRTLHVRFDDGKSDDVPGVQVVFGRLASASGDTLDLVVQTLEPPYAAASGGHVQVVLSSSDTIQWSVFSAGKLALTLLAIGALGIAFLIAIMPRT